jgi:hypothetical protein
VHALHVRVHRHLRLALSVRAVLVGGLGRFAALLAAAVLVLQVSVLLVAFSYHFFLVVAFVRKVALRAIFVV